MSKLVTKLMVLESDKNLFETDINYVIPLYQRSYAWEEKQLTQLIEDIIDTDEDSDYLIGSLIVSKQNNIYEVVDGQQRLTSLYLLLNCLGLEVPHTLQFACRDKSNYTLLHIQEIIHQNTHNYDAERVDPGIQRGLSVILQEISKPAFNTKLFVKKLSKVIVYRIIVPEHTDLNRYFEIMNTRGEQLEQHDILKASLMSYLPGQDEKIAFAGIWNACSDMDGYVQMHFTSKNNELREQIFGGGWNSLPSNNWQEYVSAFGHIDEHLSGRTISDIIKTNFQVDADEGYLDFDSRVRFESIIQYPFFLLHVLKVLVAIKAIHHKKPNCALVPELMDDKKLIDSFHNVITNGITVQGSIYDSKADFVRDFGVCLLRCRFLFDKYIIKREFSSENSDGQWSLKSLYVSGQQSRKKAYYKNTKFTKSGEWASTNDWRTKTNLMLQSAMRVSYTSPKVMHWITQLLYWLLENNCTHTGDDITNYNVITENIIQESVKENFFKPNSDGIYAMGVNTPHIVFHYLDFLLWDRNRELYKDFTFEFRNSVEHWYPQNPSEGTFEYWSEGVDRFGNLCIIQRNINSKFSNMSPEAKKSTFQDMISKGSLKLRLMSELTHAVDGQSANMAWKSTIFEQHEKEMLALLTEACMLK